MKAIALMAAAIRQAQDGFTADPSVMTEILEMGDVADYLAARAYDAALGGDEHQIDRIASLLAEFKGEPLQPDETNLGKRQREQAQMLARTALGGEAEERPDGFTMPVFAIKAKDNLALKAVDAYRALCVEAGLTEQAQQVVDAYGEMASWRLHFPHLCHQPNHAHVEVFEGDNAQRPPTVDEIEDVLGGPALSEHSEPRCKRCNDLGWLCDECGAPMRDSCLTQGCAGRLASAHGCECRAEPGSPAVREPIILADGEAFSHPALDVPPRSKCCNAPLRVDSADEGTSCYVCEKCGQPSDPAKGPMVGAGLSGPPLGPQPEPRWSAGEHGDHAEYPETGEREACEGFTGEIEVGSRWTHHSVPGIYQVVGKETIPFAYRFMLRKEDDGTEHRVGSEYFRGSFRPLSPEPLQDGGEDESVQIGDASVRREDFEAANPTPGSGAFAFTPQPDTGKVDYGERQPGSDDPMPPERRAEYRRRITDAAQSSGSAKAAEVFVRGLQDGGEREDDLQAVLRWVRQIGMNGPREQRPLSVSPEIGCAVMRLEAEHPHQDVERQLRETVERDVDRLENDLSAAGRREGELGVEVERLRGVLSKINVALASHPESTNYTSGVWLANRLAQAALASSPDEGGER